MTSLPRGWHLFLFKAVCTLSYSGPELHPKVVLALWHNANNKLGVRSADPQYE
jgi:hypothetical protein